MAGTRTPRSNGDRSLSPLKGEGVVAGTKRKPDAAASPKRDRKAAKKQTTIEETLGAKHGDTEMKDATSDHGSDGKTNDKPDQDDQQKTQVNKDAKADRADKGVEENSGDSVAKENTSNNDTHEDAPDSSTKLSTTNEDSAIEVSSQREAQVPSNILEKGMVYFFTRNRVGIEDSDSVGDLQRTFFVLRPIPTGAKLGDGTLADQDNNRLLALPKKVFPKSHNDKFMAFVEKANTTIKDLKENFFAADEYETKTLGTRRNEPITPVAEGVYAITRTEDATTHLVYSTTIPSELGEVQEDLGIKSQGSFQISVKNPERSGPASASLPQKPEFSKE